VVVVKLYLDNIIFTGFMGCGKSTISREYSRKNNLLFLDTDDLIESFENRKIKNIFEQDGEEYFRKLEAKFGNWLITNVKNSVISTGGGFSIFFDNVDKIGKVIYLKIDFDDILSRLSKDDFEKRPLLKNIDSAKELFLKRDTIYTNKADLIINANQTVENIINDISDRLKNI
jgi:shikimate kinase